MSGGHWQYSGWTVENKMHIVASDPEVQRRWPTLALVLNDVGRWFNDAEHKMDWGLSGDAPIEDDAVFDLRTVGALLDIVFKSLPDDLFARGKWATIQAWQDRIEEDRGR